jgi:hypothetical protein
MLTDSAVSGTSVREIRDALEGVQRLYTDNASLIYHVEENPTYVAKNEA